MVSEMSGNVIDICPVGALTSKPFRFSARAWEMQQYDSIAPHDSVGSNIQVHTKRDRVKRVVPGDNEAINEVWLSDRDRFSYEGIYHPDRLTTPMIREDDVWREVDWETALEFARDGLQGIIASNGAGKIGALASPSATLEELYLLQKFMRGIGSANIDHRLRQADFSDQDRMPVCPLLGKNIAELEKLDAVLLIGSNVRKEQPIINHRLRKAGMRGGHIFVVNSVDYDFNFNTEARIIVAPDELPKSLAGIIRALMELDTVTADETISNLVRNIPVTDEYRKIARKLAGSEQGLLLLGNLAAAHPHSSIIRSLSSAIAALANIQLGFIGEAANSTGAWLAGAIPHRKEAGETNGNQGLDVNAMLAGELKGYLLLGIEPELDCWNGRQASTAMQAADFVISMTAYQSDAIRSCASVMLPVAFFTETSGTFVNAEGKWQSFTGVAPAAGEARPAWKVLRVLGNLFNVNGFDYMDSLQIRDELRGKVPRSQQDDKSRFVLPAMLPETVNGIQRITDVPMNAIDALVRHAKSLQLTTDVVDSKAHINSRLAQQIGVKDGEMVLVEQDGVPVKLPVAIDDRVADRCVLIHAAQQCHARLGDWSGVITLSKV